MNSEEFLSKDESQIPVDQIFFYRSVYLSISSFDFAVSIFNNNLSFTRDTYCLMFSFFKKRQQEKALRRPPKRDADNESLEDVDDDEFERMLGGSAGGAVTPSGVVMVKCNTGVLCMGLAECLCVLRLLRGRLLLPGLSGPGPGLCRVRPPRFTSYVHIHKLRVLLQGSEPAEKPRN